MHGEYLRHVCLVRLRWTFSYVHLCDGRFSLCPFSLLLLPYVDVWTYVDALQENITILILHLVENFSEKLECVDYVETIQALKLKYEQVVGMNYFFRSLHFFNVCLLWIQENAPNWSLYDLQSLEGVSSITREAGGGVTSGGPDHGSVRVRERMNQIGSLADSRKRRDERALDKDEEDYFNEDRWDICCCLINLPILCLEYCQYPRGITLNALVGLERWLLQPNSSTPALLLFVRTAVTQMKVRGFVFLVNWLIREHRVETTEYSVGNDQGMKMNLSTCVCPPSKSAQDRGR